MKDFNCLSCWRREMDELIGFQFSLIAYVSP